MNFWDIIIIAIIAAVVGLAIYVLIGNKRKGKSSCGCGCSNCPSNGACAGNNKNS